MSQRRVRSTWWSIEPLTGWTAKHDPECVTITAVPESGAFQLSAARKSAGAITRDELREFATEEPELMGAPQPVDLPNFRGLTVAYEADGSFWRRYWLVNHDLLVFATYNGPPEVRLTEEPAVLAMLETLQREDLQP